MVHCVVAVKFGLKSSCLFLVLSVHCAVFRFVYSCHGQKKWKHLVITVIVDIFTLN